MSAPGPSRRLTLTDGTHFRYHSRDSAGLRVSFDQTDRERVWGVIPRPAPAYGGGDAQWIADYSGGPDACKTIASEVAK